MSKPRIKEKSKRTDEEALAESVRRGRIARQAASGLTPEEEGAYLNLGMQMIYGASSPKKPAGSGH
jgi:hypothetical protein